MFQTNLNHVPKIINYIQANLLYENIIPIKGSDNVRRFAKRYQQQFTVKKEDNGTIAFYCHNTPCVKITKENIIEVITGGWNTQLTARFIAKLLDNTWPHLYKNQVFVKCTIRTKNEINAYSFVKINDVTPVKFKFNSGEIIYLSGAAPVYTKVLNKVKAKKVKNKWKKVFKTARAFNTISNKEFVLQVPFKHTSGYTNIKKIPKTNEISKFIINFISSYGNYNYFRQINSMTYSSFRKKLLKMLYENNNVYNEVKLPLGVMNNHGLSNLR